MDTCECMHTRNNCCVVRLHTISYTKRIYLNVEFEMKYTMGIQEILWIDRNIQKMVCSSRGVPIVGIWAGHLWYIDTANNFPIKYKICLHPSGVMDASWLKIEYTMYVYITTTPTSSSNVITYSTHSTTHKKKKHVLKDVHCRTIEQKDTNTVRLSAVRQLSVANVSWRRTQCIEYCVYIVI